MRKMTLVSFIAAITIFAVAGCATMQTAGHKYLMKGQIIEVTDGEAYLCIGSAEGAKEGQEFTVQRYIKVPSASPKQPSPSFKREAVGAVKIKQVVDEHFAKADVIRGNVMVNDVAELGR